MQNTYRYLRVKRKSNFVWFHKLNNRIQISSQHNGRDEKIRSILKFSNIPLRLVGVVLLCYGTVHGTRYTRQVCDPCVCPQRAAWVRSSARAARRARPPPAAPRARPPTRSTAPTTSSTATARPTTGMKVYPPTAEHTPSSYLLDETAMQGFSDLRSIVLAAS